MTRTIEDISYLTADEAAEILSTTPMNILMLMKRHILTGANHDGEWLVTSDSVLAWKTAPPQEKQRNICTSNCSGCTCP